MEVIRTPSTSASTAAALTLLPFVVPYIPYILYHVYHLIINKTFSKYLLRIIKITQFASRIAPYVASVLDPANEATLYKVLTAYLIDAWRRWMSHSWLWVAGRAVKEVLKWGGIPQELFDVVEECAWGGWCLGIKTFEQQEVATLIDYELLRKMQEVTWAVPQATAAIFDEVFGKNSTVMAYGGIMGSLVDETS